jgi:hypothetical protein
MAQAVQWQSFYYSNIREYALRLNFNRMASEKQAENDRRKILEDA